MKHKIDPTIDCVFKALLGSEENKDLLIYFLNAVINPAAENVIASVEILNPGILHFPVYNFLIFFCYLNRGLNGLHRLR